MKLVITGGHLSPMLNIIEELPKEYSVFVIGRKRAIEGDKTVSLEYEAIRQKGIVFKSIIAGRLQRKWTKKTLFSILKLPIGFFQSFFILLFNRPSAVLSFGGYVSFPVVISAFLQRIPVVIHEQTQKIGLSNKIASYFAKKICISWEDSRKFFPENKVVMTGNPVKKYPISNVKFPMSNENIPLIYVTGGSSGSHKINLTIEEILPKLLEKYRVIHQTGDAKEYGDFDRFSEFKESLSQKLSKRYYVIKFVNPEDVPSVLEKADVVVSRAGANTVMELYKAEKPSILIPLPFSGADEQRENAHFLKNSGLAEIIEQDILTGEKLLEQIDSMVQIKPKLRNKTNIIKEDAALQIIRVLESVTNEKSKNKKS
ncbi:MAG: UDP-N-acetylglucosamine--N-acetylmuramyl-(pentapeptide) pyrophosphoryl-undecaprenol N-acetylglucosamine transferase [Patescibacteria group bacterium]|nr:UDP-N-acetylglucosamine--N-acetylmuramyl-(pentapeptide) pyrophosphoryl-undecaprenol N-acetylglucosamine transferase [Patescibacteria group bacterium]